MQAFDKLIGIILELKKGKFSVANMRPETQLVEDLKLDSLDLAELLVLMEDGFSLEIDPDELQDFKTLAALANYLDQRMAG
ncbi:MAG TPA: acyl carrier protein [Negativicutes bacterium]|nr:acyl carrier protein [Negativicutes bacterium]